MKLSKKKRAAAYAAIHRTLTDTRIARQLEPREDAHLAEVEHVLWLRLRIALGIITTNGIESVFAVLKRGIIGVYHRVSVKHLGRYVHEFSFRLNEDNVAIKTIDRMDSFIAAVAGKRLTYQALTR